MLTRRIIEAAAGGQSLLGLLALTVRLEAVTDVGLLGRHCPRLRALDLDDSRLATLQGTCCLLRDWQSHRSRRLNGTRPQKDMQAVMMCPIAGHQLSQGYPRVYVLDTLDDARFRIFLASASHAGLEACSSLTRLSLRDNCISSMAPLAALTALRSLDLSGNRIAVIEGLDACASAPIGSCLAPCAIDVCCMEKRLVAQWRAPVQIIARTTSCH